MPYAILYVSYDKERVTLTVESRDELKAKLDELRNRLQVTRVEIYLHTTDWVSEQVWRCVGYGP